MVTCMPLGKVKSVVADRWKGFGGGPCGGVSLAPANTSLDMAESHLDYSLCASYASGGEAAPGSISNTAPEREARRSATTGPRAVPPSSQASARPAGDVGGARAPSAGRGGA